MEISRYLAMTRAEMADFSLPPGYLPGWMACHFSPYGTGLSNIPVSLPPGSMLILNDRTPIFGHDPVLIREQLESAVQTLDCSCLLLDFQRPDNPETAVLCRGLAGQMSCPVGISDIYSRELDCPVFLPPVPPDATPQSYLSPWQGREIWLEIAPEALCFDITENGSSCTPLFSLPEPAASFSDPETCCRYHTELLDASVRFTLWRDGSALEDLLEKAAALGVTRAVGLYQQLCTICTPSCT